MGKQSKRSLVYLLRNTGFLKIWAFKEVVETEDIVRNKPEIRGNTRRCTRKAIFNLKGVSLFTVVSAGFGWGAERPPGPHPRALKPQFSLFSCFQALPGFPSPETNSSLTRPSPVIKISTSQTNFVHVLPMFMAPFPSTRRPFLGASRRTPTSPVIWSSSPT